MAGIADLVTAALGGGGASGPIGSLASSGIATALGLGSSNPGGAALDLGMSGGALALDGMPGSGQDSMAQGLAQGLARGGRAGGGGPGTNRLASGSGLVPGLGLGRADTVPASVPRGSYVLPADVVSGLGQGNTAAGAARIGGTLRSLPRFARGGRVDMVPARLSGGEYVVHPAHVTAIGRGSIDAGSRALDGLVHQVRAGAAHTALHAPAPR